VVSVSAGFHYSKLIFFLFLSSSLSWNIQIAIESKSVGRDSEKVQEVQSIEWWSNRKADHVRRYLECRN